MSTNCGCIQNEKIRTRMTTHGMSSTKLYRVWRGIKTRCQNPNSKSYCDYGERGISVCEEWDENFLVFYKWAYDNGYEESKVEIDRIDVNGNYEPNNCRWISKKKNANNKRNSKYITIKGVTKTASEWSEEIGISVSTFLSRYNKGWSDNDILNPPSNDRNGQFKPIVIEFKGESTTLKELSLKFKISKSVILKRYQNGDKDDYLVRATTPKNTPIPVRQYSVSGELIGEYSSSVEAEKITGIKAGNIRSCMNNKTNISGGYVWKKVNK
ncbi:MAG: NUMOD1 domain-containing DNA-binding protein [Paraclostridium sp.]